ncbi:transcriptional regulator CtsR [Striga asiatica]|uniref:Transcriptional regulator CtsR n=1 Tax=Striga asiatica TaxID=4170 RepID=A0A5A7PT06_STRAF|nr:transcriptional regulator CtsR [Striga asiatica]
MKHCLPGRATHENECKLLRRVMDCQKLSMDMHARTPKWAAVTKRSGPSLLHGAGQDQQCTRHIISQGPPGGSYYQALIPNRLTLLKGNLSRSKRVGSLPRRTSTPSSSCSTL